MTVLVSDSFNRADSTTMLGSTDSYNGGTSQAWSFYNGGVWGISTNQAYTPTVHVDATSYVNVTPQTDNVKVSLTIASSNIYVNGIAFRIQDANNFFRAYVTGTTLKIDRKTAGTWSNIYSVAIAGTTVTFPLPISISVTGSTITAYVNGVQQGSVTDTNFQTASCHGLYINNSGSIKEDNFFIESIATGTTTTQTLTDSVALSDSTAHMITKGLSDSQATIDALTKSPSLVKSDSISSSDSLAKQITKVLTDSQTFSDIIAKLITKTLTDSITSSDTFSQSKLSGVKTQSISDSISVSDSFVKTVIKSLSDSQVISDSINKYLSVSKSDTISLSDAISSGLLFSRSYSDSVGVSDSISRGINKGFTDTISLSDAITKYLQKILGDNIVVTDSIITHLPNAPTLIGTVTLKGDITLNVYLMGSIDTNIYLKGGYDVTQENQNFEMYVGETKKVNIPITNQNGTSANLTGSSIKWVLKKYVTSATVLVTKTTTNGGITVSNGTLTVNLVSADTQNVNIVPGNYYHQATLTDAQGDVSVLTTGTCTINSSGV